ncbi:unnamed protein product [Amoebophrya sp. A120]|nr:unnamed protein product [Amoebophrya sp. A120]|eukprot:GSA120T00001680001.1
MPVNVFVPRVCVSKKYSVYTLHSLQLRQCAPSCCYACLEYPSFLNIKTPVTFPQERNLTQSLCQYLRQGKGMSNGRAPFFSRSPTLLVTYLATLREVTLLR